MRLLAELLLAAALIAVAWQTPYRERLGQVIPTFATGHSDAPPKSHSRRALPVESPPAAEEPPASALAASEPPRAQPASAAASPAANWMWDPKRPASLDRPGQPTATPTVFTKHVYYTDEKGKKYWFDAQGKRHYEP